MAVLSLLERTPSPEPVDKDFYSEFGNKTTGTPAQLESPRRPQGLQQAPGQRLSASSRSASSCLPA